VTSQAWQQQLDGAQQKAHIFAYKKDNRKKGGRKAHAPQAWCLLDPETNTQEKFNALDDSERADLEKKFKTTQRARRARTTTADSGGGASSASCTANGGGASSASRTGASVEVDETGGAAERKRLQREFASGAQSAPRRPSQR
jgi:hypothetical protein